MREVIMKREYSEHPIVGVGGAVFEGDAVLLVRRGQEPAKGQWSLPGGVVELGETHIEALKREVREETAVEIGIGGLIGVFDRIFYDHQGAVRYHYILIDYWGRIISGRPKASSDISEVRLVPLHKLDSYGITPELRGTISQAANMREQKRDV
jgi:8-oxo-dGTP diphosphatase